MESKSAQNSSRSSSDFALLVCSYNHNKGPKGPMFKVQNVTFGLIYVFSVCKSLMQYTFCIKRSGCLYWMHYNKSNLVLLPIEMFLVS